MGREWLRRRAGVLAARDFRRFYAGYVTSLLGSSMSTVAIAWAVLESGASATGLGYVFAAAVVPQVLLLAVAGAVADRLGRRRVMLAADALRCAAQASLAGAVFAGRPALWVFVLLAWLVGTGEAFFTPALDALTVEIAPRDQLGNANALYGLASSATRIAGPALGGLLVALTGPGAVVAADAASYAVSVLALSLLRVPAHGAHRPWHGPPGAANPGAPDPVARHGRGLGRIPVPDLAVGYHRAVRLLQPDHLGALDAARAGHGPGLPGRRRGVGRDHGGAGRGRDHGRAAVPRPPPPAADSGRDHRHVLLRAAGRPDGPARHRRVGGRRRVLLRRGLGRLRHLHRHGHAAAGAAGDDSPGSARSASSPPTASA